MPCVPFDDAKASLEWNIEHKTECIVSDIQMSGMTGPELAGRLTAQRGEIRSLFVSGYRHDTLEHQGLLDRKLNLLTKPFPASELLKRVRACLSQDSVTVR